jgi:hypothetical protein
VDWVAAMELYSAGNGGHGHCGYNSNCGDLLEIFGGLQIFEWKLALDDHELTKVYL